MSKRLSSVIVAGAALVAIGGFIWVASTQKSEPEPIAAQVDTSITQTSTSNAAHLVDKRLDSNFKASRELQTIVDTFTRQYNKRVGVFVMDIDTGAMATAYENEPFVSASIYKMFVAYDVYKHIDEGKLSLNDRLGSYAHFQTIDECLDVMITVSDNDCGAALGELVDWTKLDALLKKEGYQNTVLDNYNASGALIKDKITNARDVALLLQRLYAGTLLSKASTESFIQYLKDDEINQFLPSGLPRGTVIAHKIGYLYGFVHDAGVIYGTNKNVIVVLLTGEWSSPQAQAPAIFAQLSSGIWDWMEK